MPYKWKKYYLLLAIGVLTHGILYAQQAFEESLQPVSGYSLENLKAHSDTLGKNYFIISDIIFTGDKKTRPYIIQREIPFKTGDSITLVELVNKFSQARRQLMNTRLFNDVVLSLKSFKGYLVEVQIDIKERWYLFPIPYFKPVDRNLSEWAKQGYGLHRVNYGAKLSYYNFTGRNDKLKAYFISGYTRQIQFSYEQPNADKSLKHGYGINVSYATAKEINHLTQNNEQQFIPRPKPLTLMDTISAGLFKGQVLSEQFYATLSYSYRPAINTRHAVRLSFTTNRIDEAVAVVNPSYFSNGKLKLTYPELSYTIDYNNIDNVAYPL